MTEHSDIAYWLALLRAPGVGPATFRDVLHHYPAPRTLFEASAAQRAKLGLTRATLDYLSAPDWDSVESDLAWLNQPQHHALTLHSPDYPALLREIADPPPLLFVHGDPALLAQPQLAIVGSRNPTPGGAETAHAFARHLAQAGLVITSGLALGIDAASHRGALESGGLTVAVAGTGLDRVYPARHRALAHEIAEHGALVSELPPGTPPLPDHFPRRNRIISGLSLGTLVVEAAASSGSLITARLANEQGREVFAIPGSIHNPLARGCHALLRQGAKLVETAQVVMEELGPLAGASAALAAGRSGVVAGTGNESAHLTVEQKVLLDSLSFEPAAVDTLIRRSGLTPEAVSSILLTLELQGYVTSSAGGRYIRVGMKEMT